MAERRPVPSRPGRSTMRAVADPSPTLQWLTFISAAVAAAASAYNASLARRKEQREGVKPLVTCGWNDNAALIRVRNRTSFQRRVYSVGISYNAFSSIGYLSDIPLWGPDLPLILEAGEQVFWEADWEDLRSAYSRIPLHRRWWARIYAELGESHYDCSISIRASVPLWKCLYLGWRLGGSGRRSWSR